MSQLSYTNYAFAYSETLTATGTAEVRSDQNIRIPANVGGITLGIKQKVGASPFKVQVSMSTEEEEQAGNAEWFDWEDITGLDVSGFLDQATFQWWIPIPSFMRFVLPDSATLDDTVYFSLRAQ